LSLVLVCDKTPALDLPQNLIIQWIEVG